MLRYLTVFLLGTLLCLQLSASLPVDSDGPQAIRKEIKPFVLNNLTEISVEALKEIATIIKRILDFADTNPKERSVEVREQFDKLKEFYRKVNNVTEIPSLPERLVEAKELFRSFSEIARNYRAISRKYPNEFTAELTFEGQGIDEVGSHFTTRFDAFVAAFKTKMNKYIASLSEEEKKADLFLIHWYENLEHPSVAEFTDFLELYY